MKLWKAISLGCLALVGLVILLAPAPAYRPELRSVLYPGRRVGLANDPGLEKRHPDPYRSSDLHEHRADRRLLSQTQSDA